MKKSSSLCLREKNLQKITETKLYSVEITNFEDKERNASFCYNQVVTASYLLGEKYQVGLTVLSNNIQGKKMSIEFFEGTGKRTCDAIILYLVKLSFSFKGNRKTSAIFFCRKNIYCSVRYVLTLSQVVKYSSEDNHYSHGSYILGERQIQYIHINKQEKYQALMCPMQRTKITSSLHRTQEDWPLWGYDIYLS